jgi:hypothetical protein
MNIQYIQRKMVMTVQEILSALYEGLARFGCGLAGIPYDGLTLSEDDFQSFD